MSLVAPYGQAPVLTGVYAELDDGDDIVCVKVSRLRSGGYDETSGEALHPLVVEGASFDPMFGAHVHMRIIRTLIMRATKAES